MTLEIGLQGNSALPLVKFDRLTDKEFAAEWRLRYILGRTQMIPDIARWMRLLRYFHPRSLQDHWQDQFGNPLPKLFQSQNLSVEIYNWCRPIIEVYGSLLAGQKPLPFTIDVRAADPTNRADLFRADAQEKVLLEEIRHQRIPLHFMDFSTSVVLFGIGYVYSWIDPEDRRLRTQAVAWPGDVIPQWAGDRYGRGGDGIESCIITERIPIDTAKRLYPDVDLQSTIPEYQWRPDGAIAATLPNGTVQIMKIWWRWEDNKDKDKIGYAEVAFTGTVSGEPATLYREDDTGYPDIPVRWASRFQTPGEPPHRSAGVLDDVVGINTEYNERLSALADMLMKSVYTKYKGKGFTIANIPRLAPGSNIYPMGLQQDLVPLVEQIAQAPFEQFLAKLENQMLTVSGLSRLMMGSLPPGESSGEALQNLLHSSIARLEIIRTPIQYAWVSMMEEVWVPLLVKFGRYSVFDSLVKRYQIVTLKTIFEIFYGIDWIWPDVTPRDALRAVELAMNLGKGGWLSDESVMRRAQIASPLDELEKVKTQRKDVIMHPEAVRNTAMAQQTVAAMIRATQPVPRYIPKVNIHLRGDLSPEQVQGVGNEAGIKDPAGNPVPGPAANPAGETQEPWWRSNEAGPGGQSTTQATTASSAMQQMEALNRSANDMQLKNEAAQTPVLSQEDNSSMPGQLQQAAQGVNPVPQKVPASKKK